MAEQVFGFKFPFQEGTDSTPAANETVTDAIRDSIVVICSTVKGENEMDPDEGIIAMQTVFEPDNEATRLALRLDIERTIRKYEKRAAIQRVEIGNSETEANVLEVTVTYVNIPTGQVNAVTVEFEAPGEVPNV